MPNYPAQNDLRRHVVALLMGDDHSRRRFLGAGLTVGVAPGLARWVRGATRQSDRLRIESDGGGIAAYEFTVTGSLGQVDDDDRVEGNRAVGHVGPERGTDTFRYSGDLSGVVLAGPASLYLDGVRTRTAGFPQPEGTLTSADFDPDSGTNLLRIESDSGGMAAYEFTVGGELDQRDDDDHVSGNRAWGHLGPERGVDEFEFTGGVTRFDLAGPASVRLNGSAVTPESGDSGSDDLESGGSGLVRATPGPTVTATPDSTVLFEATAPDSPNRHVFADWYVDGREYVGPGAFHGQMGGRGRTAIAYRFESPGTHEVRAEADERAESGGRGATEWTVEVGSSGNRAPSVEPVSPDGPVAASRDSSERTTFEVRAADPEGSLDRVVWWESQCDQIVAVSTVSGADDSATLERAPSAGCPLGARAIDREGGVSELVGWRYESPD